MAFCPNCGTENGEGIRFCTNCGHMLPVSDSIQPQQQTQPVQPAYQQSVNQPAYQQPVNQQPVYQQPQTAPLAYAQPAEPKKKTNGLCIAGFILSLCGIICLGITCPIGFILAGIGLILAIKKKQKGKGLAIAGLIVSALIMAGVIFLAVEYIQDIDRYNDYSTVETTDDRNASSGLQKKIEKNNWITVNDHSYLVFNKKDKSFTYYQSYLDTSDNYYTGQYRIYTGEDAFDYITGDLSDYGITKSELRQMIRMNDEYDMDNLICLCLDNEELVTDGESEDGESWTTHYYGFYLTPEKGGKTYNVLDLANMETASYITFIMESEFKDYAGDTLPTTIDNTDPFSHTETSETSMESSSESSSESSYVNEEGVMGTSITGTVAIDGIWDYWTEDDGMQNFYLDRVQRINRDTSTIINLSVFPESYNYDLTGLDIGTFADLSKEGMEEAGASDITIEKTVIGGFEAYCITGKYPDSMYLTVWYFYDNDNRLHYVSVEYYESDTASCEMVRDTYKMN